MAHGHPLDKSGGLRRVALHECASDGGAYFVPHLTLQQRGMGLFKLQSSESCIATRLDPPSSMRVFGRAIRPNTQAVARGYI